MDDQTIPMHDDDMLAALDVRPYLLQRDASLGTIMQSLFNQTEDEGGVVQTQFEVSLLDSAMGGCATSGVGCGLPDQYGGCMSYAKPEPASPATSAASAPSPLMTPLPGQATAVSYPINTNQAGEFGFTLEFSEDMMREPVNKSSNTYSPTLQKLFANQDTPCPFQFVTTNPVPFGMELRATPVFTLPHDMSKVVRRCPAHMRDFQVGGVEAREHLILVDPPGNCSYRSDDGRLSVVVPFTPGYVASHQHCMTVVYRFACHSSCKGGMNRRPISIIFTLENQGIVYGRATLKVRLCACPGRDRVKEQGGNREASADEDASATSAEPPRKRRRGRSSTAPAPTPEAPSPVAQLPSSASTTSQHLVQDAILGDEDDDKIYSIAVKGISSYRVVKQFADAIELMNQVRHLGSNMADIRQSLERTDAINAAPAAAATATATAATAATAAQVPSITERESEAGSSQPFEVSQPLSSSLLEVSQPLSSSQGAGLSGSQPLSSSQQSTASTSGRHVRFTLKRTITPKLPTL